MDMQNLASFSDVFLDVVNRETAGDTGVKEIFKEKCITHNIFSFLNDCELK